VDYSVVFDVARNGYHPSVGLRIGLLFIGVGAVLVLCRGFIRPQWRGFPLVLFLGFSVFWTVALLAITWTDYYELASALRDARCEVVEGTVTQFHPMPVGGHDVESFSVGGKYFEYSDWTITSAFHQSSTYGGPVRDGMQVRIHYLGKDIARLEVASQTI
jgi:hypothetical protein